MIAKQLWTKYQKKRTNEYRNDLVIHYLPLARVHANKVQCKIQASHLSEELFGAASLGLIHAVEAFDPKRNLKFETFSGLRIRGAIIDWLREIVPQSRLILQFEKKRQSAMDILAHDGIHDATKVAEKMGISYEQYCEFNNRLARGKQVYLSSLAPDYYPYPSSTHDMDFDLTDTENFLREFICKRLKRTHRMVLLLYYFEGRNMREIGEMMGFTLAWISQLRKDAIICMREELKDTSFQAPPPQG